MAYRVVWSPEAVEDIEAIASYIERDSPWYAKAVVSRIVDTAEIIPQHPELGRMVPEINDKSIRERFVYSYRIIYRVEEERILIATVVHGSRLLEPAITAVEGTKG